MSLPVRQLDHNIQCPPLETGHPLLNTKPPAAPRRPVPQTIALGGHARRPLSTSPAGGPAGAAGAQVLGVLPAQPTASAPPPGPVGPQLSPEEQYQLAFSLLQQFRTDEAEVAFQAFITGNPDNELAVNARYWLGETYYSRKMYAEAARTFFEAYNAAPEGAKAPDNFLKLGMSLAQMDEADNACAVLAELPQRFPNASQEILAQAAGERERLECA